MTSSEKRPVVPDDLFDADRGEAYRDDWIILDGHPVHAPIIWIWSCPQCGATGKTDTESLVLDRPHSFAHVSSVFAQVIPLDVNGHRVLDDGSAIPI